MSDNKKDLSFFWLIRPFSNPANILKEIIPNCGLFTCNDYGCTNNHQCGGTFNCAVGDFDCISVVEERNLVLLNHFLA